MDWWESESDLFWNPPKLQHRGAVAILKPSPTLRISWGPQFLHNWYYWEIVNIGNRRPFTPSYNKMSGWVASCTLVVLKTELKVSRDESGPCNLFKFWSEVFSPRVYRYNISCLLLQENDNKIIINAIFHLMFKVQGYDCSDHWVDLRPINNTIQWYLDNMSWLSDTTCSLRFVTIISYYLHDQSQTKPVVQHNMNRTLKLELFPPSVAQWAGQDDVIPNNVWGLTRS